MKRTAERNRPPLHFAVGCLFVWFSIAVARLEADVESQAEAPWPIPHVLLDQLSTLATAAETSGWAEHVQGELTNLRECTSLDSHESLHSLQRLQRLAKQAESLADGLLVPQDQSELRRIAYALDRRVHLWERVHRAAQPTRARLPASIDQSIDARIMSARLRGVLDTLSKNSKADSWVRYLLLDELAETIEQDLHEDGSWRVKLAQNVLARMHDPELTELQRDYLATEPFATFEAELLRWATHPVSLEQLLSAAEAFEARPSKPTAHELAQLWNDLRWSALSDQRALAWALESRYRNANVRFNVSEDIINRLVSSVQEMSSPVNDQVLGAQVSGHSKARTRLLVNLLPDGSRLRMIFEARGVVAAWTTSRKGPVTLFNNNESRFQANKVLVVEPQGQRTERSQAVASAATDLIGFKTSYDRFPLLGSVVRKVVRKKHDEQSPLARRLFINRVTGQAKAQLDNQVDENIATAQRQLEEKVIRPLREMELKPRAIDMKTFEDHLVLRGRLAADHQLAAFTPRPRAQKDSLLSIQLHESALNNLIEQLALDGRVADLRELYAEIQEKFGAKDKPVPDDIEENVTIRFAAEDAVRVRCDEDRVRLTLRIAKLTLKQRRSRSWRNFEVQADYRAHRDGNGVDFYFIRDPGISLKAAPRSAGLRLVFSKALSPNQKFYLINPDLASDERFADLDVTQLLIRDGWIGVSVSQSETADVAAGKPDDSPTGPLRFRR